MAKHDYNEKNYHIFYQLIDGADKSLAELLDIDKDAVYMYLRTENNGDENFENNVCRTYETVKKKSVKNY